MNFWVWTIGSLILLLFFVLIVIVLAFRRFVHKEIVPLSLLSKHVVVTGGSSGIGKAFAVVAAKLGAHVTIMARDCTKLNEAVVEIKKAVVTEDQRIEAFSINITDYLSVKAAINAIEDVSPIYMLVNCAGFAVCGTVDSLSIDHLHSMTNVNYFGTIYATQIVVPKMKERREGIIVITASQAALVGIYGLSAYSGTKFALRGFAEAIDMELKPFSISTTIAFPPDTDTPGYQTENASKPRETSLISESAGLYSAKEVATQMMKDALNKNFFSCMGFEGFLTCILCAGMSPCTSLIEFILQVGFMGLFRAIGLVYLHFFHKIIKKSLFGGK